MLIPTAATPQVAMMILFVEVAISSYSSIYDQDPDDYIMEDNETEYDKLANEFMTKMKIKQPPFQFEKNNLYNPLIYIFGFLFNHHHL